MRRVSIRTAKWVRYFLPSVNQHLADQRVRDLRRVHPVIAQGGNNRRLHHRRSRSQRRRQSRAPLYRVPQLDNPWRSLREWIWWLCPRIRHGQFRLCVSSPLFHLPLL